MCVLKQKCFFTFFLMSFTFFFKRWLLFKHFCSFICVFFFRKIKFVRVYSIFFFPSFFWIFLIEFDLYFDFCINFFLSIRLHFDSSIFIVILFLCFLNKPLELKQRSLTFCLNTKRSDNGPILITKLRTECDDLFRFRSHSLSVVWELFCCFVFLS